MESDILTSTLFRRKRDGDSAELISEENIPMELKESKSASFRPMETEHSNGNVIATETSSGGVQEKLIALEVAYSLTKKYNTKAVSDIKSSCEAGNTESCIHLSSLLKDGKVSFGQGSTFDRMETERILATSCQTGDIHACTKVGVIAFDNGQYDRSYPLWKSSCEAGDSEACFHQGLSIELQEGADMSPENSLKFYGKSCEDSYGPACTALGMLHLKGKFTEKSLEKSVEYFQKGCNLGNGRGCLNLAEISNEPADSMFYRETILPALSKECKKGNNNSCVLGGSLLSEGKIQGKSNSAALRLYKRACSRNDGYGCFKGAMTALEKGSSRDAASAAEMFKQSCDAGIADGCYNLSMLFNRKEITGGKEMGQHFAKRARLLYSQGCDQNEPYSCIFFGKMSQLGNGGEMDLKLAKKMYKKAIKLEPEKVDAWERLGTVQKRQDVLDTGCKLGSMRSCFEYAKLVQESVELSQKILFDTCQKGDNLSCEEFSKSHVRTGTVDKAVSAHQKLCTQGISHSCNEYAKFIASGISKDRESATAYYRRSCKLDNGKGCYGLGTLLEKLKQDGAHDAYQRGCVLGDWSSCQMLSFFKSQ